MASRSPGAGSTRIAATPWRPKWAHDTLGRWGNQSAPTAALAAVGRDPPLTAQVPAATLSGTGRYLFR